MTNALHTRRRRGARSFFTAWVLCVALAAQLAFMDRARAQDGETGDDKDSLVEEGLYSCGKARGPVSVSFKPDVDLKDLITWAMGFTCRNFVYDASVANRSKKVTIIAPKKMTSPQAWRVFLVGLQTMGLTVVPQGNVLRVVEAGQAKTEPLPLYRRGGPGATSQLVRVVIRPEHIPVEDLNTALGALKSKEGDVTALPKVGILVVTDYGANISKMRSFLREVDRPIVGERLYMIKVIYADATELVGKLNEILGTAQSATPAPAPSRRGRQRARNREQQQDQGGSSDEVEAALPSKMIADERTNSIILLASEAAYLRVRSLIKRLDVRLGLESDNRIYVYPLANADAEEMANTLSAVISGITQPSTGQGGRTPAARRPVPAPASAGDSTPAFEGQVRVTHDKPTNSLVIIASRKDYLAVKTVIEELDIPRRQVFIEAIILEVTADDSRDLGASFHGGTATGDGALVLGGLQHSELRSINPASLAGLSGLLGGILGPLLAESAEFFGVSIPSYGVLFQALATTNNVNVLSSPHLLTTDNEEASISVGQNIPYQASFSNLGGGQAGGGFAIPVTSVSRQEVALKLTITPHVNQSDMVRLKIDQEISDIASPNFEGLGPSWSRRAIQTTVVVRDQQSIVIGGLMRDRTTYTESKIPLLGDIPLLGYLFKYSQKGKTKTNLLVVLTPYVIKDQLDIDAIVRRKARESNEFVRTFSNFATMEFEADIDYRRKRGLVEEINRTLALVDKEEQELEAARFRGDVFPDGLIEYNGDGEPGDEEGDDGAQDGVDGGEAPPLDVAPESPDAPASPPGAGGGE